MDLNLPFGSAAWEPRWRRRRSERGPISLAVRALLELPKEIVEEILRLINWRYLEYKPGTLTRAILPWAGTQRMVNRRYLVHRFWSYEGGPFNPPEDHMFTIQFPQPLVY